MSFFKHRKDESYYHPPLLFKNEGRLTVEMLEGAIDVVTRPFVEGILVELRKGLANVLTRDEYVFMTQWVEIRYGRMVKHYLELCLTHDSDAEGKHRSGPVAHINLLDNSIKWCRTSGGLIVNDIAANPEAVKKIVIQVVKDFFGF